MVDHTLLATIWQAPRAPASAATHHIQCNTADVVPHSRKPVATFHHEKFEEQSNLRDKSRHVAYHIVLNEYTCGRKFDLVIVDVTLEY